MEAAKRHRQKCVREDKESVFDGVFNQKDFFSFVICNPPFYASESDANKANQRKNRKLGKGTQGRNFSGQSHEIWCLGGELQFIKTMVRESVYYAKQCVWFSALVSDKKHLPILENMLENYPGTTVRVLPMSQGQKSSRILAWSFAH